MTLPKPSIEDLRIDRAEPRESGAGIWILLLLVLVVLGAGTAVGWQFMKPKALTAQTAVVKEASVSATTSPSEKTVLNASGYVTARREATVSSKITGKVDEVLVEEGMKVTQGQLLATLDATNVKASLALAEAQLTSTLIGLEETHVRIREADRELKRQTELRTKNLVTQADYDQAEASALALKAKLKQQQAEATVAQRTVDSWLQQVEDTFIRAPFAGIVTSKNAQPGEMISPMSSGGFTRTGICTIVDMQSLEIEIDVNESYINRVKPGQGAEATLDAYSEWKIPCKVIAVIPTADRQKSTVRVRVAFEKLDPRILPEMSVKVGFREAASEAPGAAGATSGTMSGAAESSATRTSASAAETSGTQKKPQRGYAIPAAAVVQEDSGREVVYVVKDSRAERRAVSVVSRGADEVVLNAGVSAGDRVLVAPPKGLADNAAVREQNP